MSMVLVYTNGQTAAEMLRFHSKSLVLKLAYNPVFQCCYSNLSAFSLSLFSPPVSPKAHLSILKPSIAPHNFAHSISPPTRLWCWWPPLPLIEAEILLILDDLFLVVVWRNLCFGVEVSEGSGSRWEGQEAKQEANVPLVRVWVCLYVFI